MFEEQLKKELDQIKPEETVKQKVRNEMRHMSDQMRGAPDKDQRGRMTRIVHSRWTAAVAAALCVCLVALSVVGWPRKNGGNTEGDILMTGKVPATVTYEAIYDLFDAIYKANAPDPETDINLFVWAGGTKGENAVDGGDGGALETVVNEDAVAEKAETEGYSTTNRQVAEVDEADVVKTDGKYIYVLNQRKNRVTVVSADPGAMQVVGTIDFSKDLQGTGKLSCSDMYVSGDRLVLIGMCYVSDNEGASTTVYTEFYDITNPSSPHLIDRLSQSGGYLSSRLYDGTVYVFSDQTFYGKPDRNDISTYVPVVGNQKETCTVEAQDICVFSGEIDRRYLTVTSADLQSGERLDSKTVLGGGDTLYVNTDSVYAAAAECTARYLENSGTDTDQTRLIRLEINRGTVTAKAEGAVAGRVLNQFSMDEYQGYFRIVTTVETVVKVAPSGGDSSASGNASAAVSYPAGSAAVDDTVAVSAERTNALYVLDRDLKQVGSVEGLAPGEQVYSVRFLGAYSYFVTFRQVDPLFAVDLSDPTAPKVLSALKIPGFSRYLHPYEDGLLLGIGNDADAATGRSGFAKLSMFDISDPANVTEQDKTLLDCYYTQVEWTHKAALIDSEKNLIAFMGNDAYYIYGYQRGQGFSLRARLYVKGSAYEAVRGLYIGEVFYVCSVNGIDAYRLNGFEKIASLSF